MASSDYVKVRCCLKEWLDNRSSDDIQRKLTLVTDERLRIDITLALRLLGSVWASTSYSFELELVPVEAVNGMLWTKLLSTKAKLTRLREHEQEREQELKKARLDPTPSNSPPVCFRTTIASLCSLRRVGWGKVPPGLFAVTDDAQIRCLRAGQYIVAVVAQPVGLRQRLLMALVRNGECVRRSEKAGDSTLLATVVRLNESDKLTLNYTSGVPTSGHFAAIRLGD
ncbi:hypothetical protein BBJ28_00019245 [Nothophytophthora sp. Chile5]|nr:hypothetical protein BBJ28_00019245 [Nothophytophthora sp. Chile5]